MHLKVKKLSDKAVIPTKNSGDAGYDLYATHNQMLAPMERGLFKTNIAVEIPTGFFGQICDRSGNAYKKGLHVIAGIIDETYRGDVGVVLINLNRDPVIIKEGDKIAQIIYQTYFDFEQVETDELSESERGEKGYGSSDVVRVLEELNQKTNIAINSQEKLGTLLFKIAARPGFGPLSPRLP